MKPVETPDSTPPALPKPTVEVSDVTLGYLVNALLNQGSDFDRLREMKVTDILTEYEMLRIK